MKSNDVVYWIYNNRLRWGPIKTTCGERITGGPYYIVVEFAETLQLFDMSYAKVFGSAEEAFAYGVSQAQNLQASAMKVMTDLMEDLKNANLDIKEGGEAP